MKLLEIRHEIDTLQVFICTGQSIGGKQGKNREKFKS